MPDCTLDTKAILLDRLYRICDEAPLPQPNYSSEQADKINTAFDKVLDLIEPYASQR